MRGLGLRVAGMFITPAETIDWEVRNVASRGDVVFTERVDRFRLGGRQVELAVASSASSAVPAPCVSATS